MVLALCLPALSLLGFVLALAASLSGFFPAQELPPPDGIYGWAAVILTSLTVGYLEETYFRLYLPERCRAASFGPRSAFIIPALIFGFCHAYEGPWGFANALFAGLLLAAAYNKTRSFHGIALAHGFYNILVYLSAGLR
ncbi:hypothetical protein AGMMS50230_19210 [Spirochaetia bacterium]|nr:hypothetical protein AGMMS50230_19210 [Spirochaetia bacterium]